MWEFPEGRFVPHQQGADSTAPVAIATAAETPAAGRTVMINLDASPVPQPGDFERLLEIVPALEKHRLASREKFRAYRGQGLEPTTLPLTKS
jgi:DNA polymerase-3 subunit chi